MIWPSPLRVRLWWERASWVPPVLGVWAGLLLVSLAESTDELAYELSRGDRATMSTSAATTILSSIGGGMVAFTGMVFAVILLVIQFGSSAYSPRTVSFFLRARSVQWVLAVFLATITFSFLGPLDVGSRGRADYVPTIAVAFAVLLLLASLVGFSVLLHTVGSRMRVDAVLARIGARARAQLQRRAPGRLVPDRDELLGPPDPDRPGPRTVRYERRGGQVVAIDVRRLRRAARSTGAVIEVSVRVGDAVGPGTPIGTVHGAPEAVDRRIARALVVDVERSLRHDPVYALRLLVDIAVRALSPGVNDPTTAVRALDEIEPVLRAAAGRDLGLVAVDAGAGLVLLSRMTWDELVDLALLEVTSCGADQVQVTRRLAALLDDLSQAVPEPRRPVLRAYREHVATIAAQLPGRLGVVAARPDRQGLGGSGAVGPQH